MSFPSIPIRIARRLAAIIGLLSLVVALGGCSAIKLGYESLPQLSYWWLDGYIDVDDAQRPLLREDIARLHAWHRATELPRYIVLLQGLERMAAADVSPEQACALEPALRERFAALRERAEPALVTNAMALAPAQLEHLRRKYEQNNREYTREWVRLAPAEQLDKRVKELVERAEMVYGTLDERQRGVLRAQLASSPYDPATVLAERRRRQQDTLEVLRRVASQPVSLDEARTAVRGLLDRFLESPDPAYRGYVDAMRKESCRLASAVHNSTSGTQREFAVRRLRAWQRDLAELSSPQ